MLRWIIMLVACATGAQVIADVAVSVSMGEPGFYGRINIGDFPHPQLVFPQPIIVKPVVGVVHSPVYLRVPPGHYKDWNKHCGKYNACGERVFFVQDYWYNDIYVPAYNKKHGKSKHSQESGKKKQKD